MYMQQEQAKMAMFNTSYDDIYNMHARKNIGNFNTTAMKKIIDFLNGRRNLGHPPSNSLLDNRGFYRGNASLQDTQFVGEHLYMFDIMTISMNILSELHTVSPDNYLKWLFDYVDANKATYRLLHPNDMADVLANEDIVRYFEQKKLASYLPGLFWFSVLIYLFARVCPSGCGITRISETKGGNEFNYFEIERLNENFMTFIFPYFQFISIDANGIPALFEHFNAFQPYFNEIKIKLMTPLTGGKRLRTPKQKRTRFHKLKDIQIFMDKRRLSKKQKGGQHQNPNDRSYKVDDIKDGLPRANWDNILALDLKTEKNVVMKYIE